MHKKTAQIEPANQQTNGLLIVWDSSLSFLCVLAGFPYEKFELLRHGGDRAKVLGRGAAVIISLAACLMAVGQNAEALFSHAYVVYILLPVVIIFDRVIVSNSYGDDIDPMMKRCRYGLILITIYITFGSALISEQDNLLKKLYMSQEEQALLSNPGLRDRVKRIEQDRKAIRDNEIALQERSALESDRIENLRLADLEEKGMSGIDPKSQRIVKGGGRGPRYNTYQSNADAAQARLDSLDVLDARNLKLQLETAARDTELQTLLKENYLDDPNSMGTLVGALQYANWGIWFRILPNTLVLLMFELSALAMAHFKASQNMRNALSYIKDDDAQRLMGAHKVDLAKTLAEHAKYRSSLSASLPPIVVQIPSKKAATSHGAQAVPKTEQVRPNCKASNDDLMEEPENVL